MKVISGENVNELYLKAIEAVSEKPDFIVKPRGMEVKELTNVMLELRNPQSCLVTLKERRLNYAFAVAEKLQYLTGDADAERLTFYNPNYAAWRNVYGLFDGDYAVRIHYWLEYVYRLLKKDPDTRQAVYTIYGVQDRHESKDIPCTIMHHFMLRKGTLSLTSYMRSNDLLWGFPYDVNGFCFLLEFLTSALGVEVGTYTHIVGSLHLYVEREAQLTKLLVNEEANDRTNPVMEREEFGTLMDAYQSMAIAERSMRNDRPYRLPTNVPSVIEYFEALKKKKSSKAAS